MMQRWRREAYPPRQYEAISHYVPAECISSDDAKMLTEQLYTSLNGYLGPSYNYDDNNLTEEWMMNYQDLYTKPSDDDVIRTQVESILDILMGQIQDKICNDSSNKRHSCQHEKCDSCCSLCYRKYKSSHSNT